MRLVGWTQGTTRKTRTMRSWHSSHVMDENLTDLREGARLLGFQKGILQILTTCVDIGCRHARSDNDQVYAVREAQGSRPQKRKNA